MLPICRFSFSARGRCIGRTTLHATAEPPTRVMCAKSLERSDLAMARTQACQLSACRLARLNLKYDELDEDIKFQKKNVQANKARSSACSKVGEVMRVRPDMSSCGHRQYHCCTTMPSALLAGPSLVAQDAIEEVEGCMEDDGLMMRIGEAFTPMDEDSNQSGQCLSRFFVAWPLCLKLSASRPSSHAQDTVVDSLNKQLAEAEKILGEKTDEIEVVKTEMDTLKKARTQTYHDWLDLDARKRRARGPDVLLSGLGCQ
eukprot:797870-Amphidinium_carterae.1